MGSRSEQPQPAPEAEAKSDIAYLIALCREEAEGLRERARRDQRRGLKPDVFENEGRRVDRLADWLGQRDTLPMAPIEYPCVLCEAQPEEACSLDRGSFHYGRGWRIGTTLPGDNWRGENRTPIARCTPSAESGPGSAYRAVCLGDGCEYQGPIRKYEGPAVEDAMDHAFPGWRQLPVVPRVPEERKARAKWIEEVTPHLPEGWLERGGPIRTHRGSYGTRSHPLAQLPRGNWDMSAGEEPEIDLRVISAGQLTLDVAVTAPAGGRRVARTRTPAKEPTFSMGTLF